MAQVLSRGAFDIAAGPAAVGPRVVGMLRLWLGLYTERRALDRLDSRMLCDIGLSLEDVRREAGRAIWDVPAQRLPY